jgi:hypothetical protein
MAILRMMVDIVTGLTVTMGPLIRHHRIIFTRLHSMEIHTTDEVLLHLPEVEEVIGVVETKVHQELAF